MDVPLKSLFRESHSLPSAGNAISTAALGPFVTLCKIMRHPMVIRSQ